MATRQQPSSAERRTNDRRRVNFEVLECQVPGRVRARARDLSPTGIQLERPNVPHPGPDAVVPLLLHVPGRTDPLAMSAVLVWSRGTRAGFEFVSMDTDERALLRELVDEVAIDSARSVRRLAAMAEFHVTFACEADEG